MKLEYEITDNKIIISHNPWTGKELKDPFVIRKLDIRNRGITEAIDKIFKEQLIPAREELKRLRRLENEMSAKDTHARSVLTKAKETLKVLNKINEYRTEKD